MTVISKDGNCEWDEEKDLINRKKHHISFELASKVFYDPLFLEIEDGEGYIFLYRRERFWKHQWYRNHYFFLYRTSS